MNNCMSTQNQEEIEKFLAAVVQGCAKYIDNQNEFCFDIKFQIGEIVYRLSMAQQEKENDYLKEN